MRKYASSSFDSSAKIYVSGHQGMLGGALVDALRARGAKNLLLRTRQELDLRDQGATDAFFAQEKPDYAFLSAAKTGGIAVNISQPAQFLHENVLIAANTIHSAHRYGVKKLIFIGSASAYPQHTLQPMREEQLFMGHLEPSLAPYAMGKIIGLKLCESYRDQHNCNFIAVNPPNLYGKVSDADLDSASVLPALLTKMHEAKLKKVPAVEIWGTGKPKREFMHVEDMARACILLMERYDAVPEQVPSFINVGVGEDLSIAALAHLIKKVVGYAGELRFNPSKPDGVFRKLLDSSRSREFGFTPEIALEKGIQEIYSAYEKA